MKANDIMIGDWVHLKSDKLDLKVLDIETRVREVVRLERGLLWHRCGMRDIEPIPLTKEILKANGIKYQLGMPWYQGGYEGEFELHYSNRDVVGIGDLKTDITLTCRYVHELQHLLRMCGIDKEIVL